MEPEKKRARHNTEPQWLCLICYCIKNEKHITICETCFNNPSNMEQINNILHIYK